MGTIREVDGVRIMTHFFSTQPEVNKFVGLGRGLGWYYQIDSDATAKMHGPFKVLSDLLKTVRERRAT